MLHQPASPACCPDATVTCLIQSAPREATVYFMTAGAPRRSPAACIQVAPYLRGEWDGDKTGLSTPAEQRIARAVDSLLGAVPVWFKVHMRATGAGCGVPARASTLLVQ